MECPNVTEQSINKSIKLFSLEGLKGLHTHNKFNFSSKYDSTNSKTWASFKVLTGLKFDYFANRTI